MEVERASAITHRHPTRACMSCMYASERVRLKDKQSLLPIIWAYLAELHTEVSTQALPSSCRRETIQRHIVFHDPRTSPSHNLRAPKWCQTGISMFPTWHRPDIPTSYFLKDGHEPQRQAMFRETGATDRRRLLSSLPLWNFRLGRRRQSAPHCESGAAASGCVTSSFLSLSLSLTYTPYCSRLFCPGATLFFWEPFDRSFFLKAGLCNLRHRLLVPAYPK